MRRGCSRSGCNRLIPAVGSGSTAADFQAFARNFETRFSVLNDSVSTLRKVFEHGSPGDTSLDPWPVVHGGPPIYPGSGGNGVERAARCHDGWIAPAMYRAADAVRAALSRYRGAGGGRAIVPTIPVAPKTDLGELRALLEGFAAAGFDDAVVPALPGAPAPGTIRSLID